MKIRKLNVKNIILFMLIIIFIFSMSKIIIFYVDLNKNNKNTNELIDKVINIEIEETTKKEVTKIDFDMLLSINKDTIGWIQFNDNKINNPILHTKDNSYYLKHSFEKEYNQAGTIFMDYRNTSFDDKNVVLFGHAMLDDTMFGSIKDIFKKDFFNKKENNYIKIYNNKNELLTYQIFSYYVIEKEEYYITTSFNDDSDFNTFIDTLIKRSYKKFDVDVSTNDNILTLSTCSGTGGTSKRKVVHAKRVSSIEGVS